MFTWPERLKKKINYTIDWIEDLSIDVDRQWVDLDYYINQCIITSKMYSKFEKDEIYCKLVSDLLWHIDCIQEQLCDGYDGDVVLSHIFSFCDLCNYK